MPQRPASQYSSGRWYAFQDLRAGLLTFIVLVPFALADDDDNRIRAFESGLRPAVHVQGEPEVRWTVEERMAHYKVPGLSVAVIREGEIAWAKGYGLRHVGSNEPIDTDTVFSVGSLSKVGTAAVTLRLVDDGQLDLDRDVNAYLSRWKVPVNGYTAIRPVTLRGILSHSAGLTVNGFADFLPGEPLPGVIDVLEGRPPAKSDPVIADYVPGTRKRYSGGGTTVEQLVIEELSGLQFTEAARRYVFASRAGLLEHEHHLRKGDGAEGLRRVR